MKKVETTLRNIECTFEFKCDKQWDDLETQIASNIKFCTQCKKDVYLCKTQEELDHARSLGRCISIERVEIRMFTTGIPYRVKDTKVAQLVEDTEVAELIKEADALYASRKKRANPSEFDL
jgi:hypothetical protein